MAYRPVPTCVECTRTATEDCPDCGRPLCEICPCPCTLGDDDDRRLLCILSCPHGCEDANECRLPG